MQNAKQHMHTHSVGTYPQMIAFRLVRELEHAGIRTQLVGAAESYDIRVSEADYERAIGRI